VLEAASSAGSSTVAVTLWVVNPAVSVNTGSSTFAGDVVTASGERFTPGGAVEVWVHSTPTLLATVFADADGVVHFDASGLALGVHHFVFKDLTTGTEASSAPFTVEQPVTPAPAVAGPAGAARVDAGKSLASTGANASGLGLLALALLVAGIPLRLVTRRAKQGGRA
jgi:hypothetical protein